MKLVVLPPSHVGMESRLFGHKEMKSSTRAFNVSTVQLSSFHPGMRHSRQLVASRLAGVPNLPGLPGLCLKVIDLSSLKAMITSLKYLRVHVAVAIDILQDLKELKRENFILTSDSLVSFIASYLDNNYIDRVKVITTTDSREKLDITISSSPGLMSMVRGIIDSLPYFAFSSVSEPNVRDYTDSPLRADLIAAMIQTPTITDYKTRTVLEYSAFDKGPAHNFMHLYKQAFDSYKATGSQGGELDSELASMTSFLLPRIVDITLSLLMDSGIQLKIFEEVDSRIPRARNEARQKTLQRLESVLHLALNYPSGFALSAIKGTYDRISSMLGFSWALDSSFNDNYNKYSSDILSKLAVRDLNHMHNAINDPALQPYRNYPHVMIKEFIQTSGFTSIVSALAAADAPPSMSSTTDLNDLTTKKEYMRLMEGTPLASHQIFEQPTVFLRAANNMKDAINTIILSSSIIREERIPRTELSKADEILAEIPIMFCPKIATAPLPQIISSNIMKDNIPFVSGTCPETGVTSVMLQMHASARFPAPEELLENLSNSHVIMFDVNRAARLANLIGVPKISLYPASIIKGHGQIHTFQTDSGHELNLHMLSTVTGVPSTSFKYLFAESQSRKIMATLLSSCGLLIYSDEGVSDLTALKQGIILGQIYAEPGYGKPYGLDYSDLHSLISEESICVPLDEANRIMLVLFSRIPVPLSSEIQEFTFGPLGHRFIGFQPGTIDRQYKPAFVEGLNGALVAADSLLQFATSSIHTSSEFADRSITMTDIYGTKYMLASLSQRPTWDSQIEGEYSLPKTYEWEGPASSMFLDYAWFRPASYPAIAAMTQEFGTFTKGSEPHFDIVKPLGKAIEEEEHGHKRASSVAAKGAKHEEIISRIFANGDKSPSTKQGAKSKKNSPDEKHGANGQDETES